MIPYQDLFKQLNEHTYILTPHEVLADFIQYYFTQYQISLAKKIWIKPNIQVFSTWLVELTKKLGLAQDKKLLSSYIQTLVWKDIIPKDNPLISHQRGLIPLAQDALQLVYNWQLNPKDWASGTVESEFFQKWFKQFEDFCIEQNWIDFYALYALLIENLKKDKPLLQQPAKIIFVGFATLINPQLQSLILLLQKKGWECIWYESPKLLSNSHYYVAQNSFLEIQGMANWVKEQTKTATSIGCIIPDLPEFQAEIYYAFEESKHIACSSKSYFNLCIPHSMAQADCMRTALFLLKLLFPVISVEDLRYLLSSPFIDNPLSAYYENALLEISLSQQYEKTLSLDQCFKLFQSSAFWIKRLEHCQNLIHQMPRHAFFIDWIDFFQKTLSQLGWIEENSLFFTQGKGNFYWQKMLEELRCLNLFLTIPLSLEQAYKHFCGILETIIVYPMDSAAPVQIFDPQVAQGFCFNAVWIGQLSLQKWPPVLMPNPFIPLAIQRMHSMPHTSLYEQERRGEIFLKNCIQGTSLSVFSYSIQDKEQSLEPSGYLSKHALKPLPLDQKNIFYKEHSEDCYEYINEEYVNPVSLIDFPLEKGIAILEDQASCPFRSYAKYRLKAWNILDKNRSILTASQKGQLLHASLYYIWGQWISLHRMRTMPLLELEQGIQEGIVYAFNNISLSAPLPPYIVEIEKERLFYLLKRWFLEVELQRTPFTVLEREKKMLLKLADFECSIYIDRIDQLETGEYILIDYKTSLLNMGIDIGEDIDSLQLAAYSTASPLAIEGLILAQLRQDQLELRGWVKKEKAWENFKKTVKGIPNWSLQMQSWEKVLMQLSKEFLKGHAKVNPKKPSVTCQFCDLKSLCRFHIHAH